MKKINRIIQGDALKELKELPTASIDCVITSPPYWGLRDYGVAGQLGLENTYEEYIEKLCDIFDEVKRVLAKDGTCFVNIGDTYGTQSGAMRDGKFGQKNTNNQKFIQPKGIHKCLLQIPSRFSIEMINRGWILRNEIIWNKPNSMPSSVKDRFTVDFEKLFFFTKSPKYYFKQQLEDSVNRNDLEYRHALRREKGYTMKKPYENNFPKQFRNDGKRNMRTTWTIATKPFKEAHFAVYPEELCRIPIQAGCPKGGTVLDPFVGAGTTIVVANRMGCNGIGIELNREYIKIAKKRIKDSRK